MTMKGSERGKEMQEGDRLGRYVLEELLVRNPRARVFLASYDEADGATGWCVMRCVAPEAADTDFEDHFMTDARVAAAFSHPNIVKVLDVGLVDGISYLAMERVRGVDLLTVFGQAKRSTKPVPLDVALWAAHQACDGLRYIHEMRGRDGSPKELVHRNVALSNLMISDQGVTKLLDFGVSGSEALGAVPGFAHKAGRVDYVSPEQARGERIDGRSDVFSLGVVMHELFTGHRLFHKEGQHVRPEPTAPAEIRRPSSIRRDLSPQMESIVMRALAHEPDERYPSVNELQEAIGSQLLGEPEDGRKRLSDFVAERFGDRLAEIDAVRPTAAASSSAAAAAGSDATKGDERASPPAPQSPESGERDRRGRKVEEPEKKRGSGRLVLVLGRVAAVLTISFIAAAGIFIYLEERGRPPSWSLEAWRESEAGKLAVPERIAAPPEAKGSESKRRGTQRKATSRPVSEQTTRAEEMGLTGELVVVCPHGCTVFVDGERKRPDSSSGAIELGAGQVDLVVEDDATDRRHEARVMIAPGRVHVEEVDFPPTFDDRTGMEEW